ncbi:MAG: ABC transporter ATP-binding protein [Bacilli bacterium]|nr:ABC transporter ATP-binding protein [Bacilli bacterium]
MNNYKRLFHFLKGRFRYLIVSLIMIFIIQLLNFISPLIVKTLLDDYIMGIEYDWVEVTSEDKHTVNYLNRIFKQVRYVDSDDVVIKDVSIFMYEGKVYFVDELIEVGQKEVLNNQLTITNGESSYTYDALCLTSDEIYSFYNPMLYSIIIIILILFVKSVLTIVCNFVQQMCTNRSINRMVMDERINGMKAIESLPICEFENEPAGKMASRITHDVDGLLIMYRQILNLFFSAILSFVLAYVGMFHLDTKLALLTLIFYPFVFLWIRLFLRLLKKISERVNESRSMLTAKINEIINGINILQIFNFKHKTINEFNEISEEYRTQQLKGAKLSLTSGWNMLNVLRGLITTFVIAYFGWQYTNVKGIVVTAGLVYAYNEYILKLVDPINIIFTQISAFQDSHVQVRRYHKLIESKKESYEKHSIKRYDGKIKFDNIWFSYIEDNYVLKGVSFDVEPGQMIGLVGHTGSGKSSLINLLLRFYDINNELSGKIYVDDMDITQIEKRTYREHIGIVLQEPVLFKGTIASNIKFGKEVSDEEVEKVLTMIGGKKIIDKFPQGIHQKITRSGLNMSAGEKQLISLARVLIHDPSILIMDEATSHIDLETEEMVKNALQVVSKDRTVIVIAHRLSTIFDADKIIVLDHGLKVEEGRHEELVKANGVYANIYRAQTANINLK